MLHTIVHGLLKINIFSSKLQINFNCLYLKLKNLSNSHIIERNNTKKLTKNKHSLLLIAVTVYLIFAI